MLMAVDGPATGPSQTATRHRTTRSRKLLSGVVGCEVERQPIEPKNLYDGHRHAVSGRGDNASAADHLWMAGGDRRLKHSILGELAGPSGCRCPRIFRLHAEQVARPRSCLSERIGSCREGRRKSSSHRTRRWRKPDSNFWSLNQSSSAGVNAGRHAGHIRHVCFRRAPRINPARDSAIAPRQPHPERKGRSAPGLTPGAADAHLAHRLGPALLPHAAR